MPLSESTSDPQLLSRCPRFHSRSSRSLADHWIAAKHNSRDSLSAENAARDRPNREGEQGELVLPHGRLQNWCLWARTHLADPQGKIRDKGMAFSHVCRTRPRERLSEDLRALGVQLRVVRFNRH